MASQKRRRVEMVDDSALLMLHYPPTKYKHRLACPFSKHNPDLYMSVHNVCTCPPGFEKIHQLNDHINRVHSAKFGCIICKKRAPQFKESKEGQSKKATIDEWKLTHPCKPRDFTEEDAEWMTEDQEKRFLAWKDGKSQKGGPESWTKIYMALFEVVEGDVPSPYWDYFVPRHLLPTSQASERHQTPTYIDSFDDLFGQTTQDHVETLGSSSTLNYNKRPVLDLDALESHSLDNKYAFDWTVKPAIDSGYGSQEQQELETPFTTYPQYLNGSSATAMLALTAPDESPLDLGNFLDLEEDLNGKQPRKT